MISSGNNFLEFCGEIPEAEKLFMPATKPGEIQCSFYAPFMFLSLGKPKILVNAFQVLRNQQSV